jgi:hypothetical protein
MLTVVAPVTLQDKMAAPPALMTEGVALKKEMTGA